MTCGRMRLRRGGVADYMKNVKEIAIPIRKDHGVKLGGVVLLGGGASEPGVAYLGV